MADLLAKHLLLATACRDPQLTAAALAVLAVIIERFNEKEGEARPSFLGLARDTKCSRKTCERAVSLLLQSGYIEVESGSRNRTNRYKPSFQKGKRLSDVPIVAGDDRKVSSSVSKGIVKNVPDVSSSVTMESTQGSAQRILEVDDGAGAAALAAGAADAPAPSPSLRAEFMALEKRGGRPLDLDAVACDVRDAIKRGAAEETITSALQLLAKHTHWTSFARALEQVSQKPARAKRMAFSANDDFRGKTYSKVPQHE